MKISKEYSPIEHSIVQALLKPDTTHRYEVSDFVEALVFSILRELKRVYWNSQQESLDDRADWQLINMPGGFEYRRYYWGEQHELCGLPNMKFMDVVINWYKYPGRGMSTNVDWDEKQWREWFDAAMKAVRLYDSCMQPRHSLYRAEDEGRVPFTEDGRIQCMDCKYCLSFGANTTIWNRDGSRDVRDAK